MPVLFQSDSISSSSMDYLKYYDLEDYLFNDVNAAFHARGYLTPEEFFSIVVWKANRAITRIKKRLLGKSSDLAEVVKNLTENIKAAPSDEARLRVLLETWGFLLPMATAILTVLYPDRFTVYDVRVREQLQIKDFAGRKNEIKRYFEEFLPGVAAITETETLRDKDRYLWGKSSYESLREFLSAQ
jgi:hypothetical protein